MIPKRITAMTMENKVTNWMALGLEKSDARIAGRSLGRRPGFAAAVVVSAAVSVPGPMRRPR